MWLKMRRGASFVNNCDEIRNSDEATGIDDNCYNGIEDKKDSIDSESTAVTWTKDGCGLVGLISLWYRRRLTTSGIFMCGNLTKGGCTYKFSVWERVQCPFLVIFLFKICSIPFVTQSAKI